MTKAQIAMTNMIKKTQENTKKTGVKSADAEGQSFPALNVGNAVEF